MLALQPGFVETRSLIEAKERGPTPGLVTVSDCVSAALRDLGYEKCTYGPLVHEAIGFLMTFIFRNFGCPKI